MSKACFRNQKQNGWDELAFRRSTYAVLSYYDSFSVVVFI